jgi:hypothetical protein
MPVTTNLVFSLGLQLLPPANPIDAGPADAERLGDGRGAEACSHRAPDHYEEERFRCRAVDQPTDNKALGCHRLT